MPTPTRSSLFGVPLEELMGYNGEKGGVPRVIKDAAHYLRDTGTATPLILENEEVLTLLTLRDGR